MKALVMALVLWSGTLHAQTEDELIAQTLAAFAPYEDVVLPQVITDAIVASEDRTYFERDAWRSTITLSAIRQFAPATRQSRAIALPVSIAVARRYSHDTILAALAENVDLGRGCEGMRAAASAFFGTPPEALTIAQAARLAALMKAPELFLDDTERRDARTDWILETLSQNPAYSRFSEPSARSKALQDATIDAEGRCN